MKRTPRQRKMALKKELIETYDLPQLDCQRWGTTKGATRTDILRGMLWNVFSKCIRHRDVEKNEGKCISCGHVFTFRELQAGHFAPVGGTSVDLWFSENNVNGECEKCNAFDSFHLVPMRANLILRYGLQIVENIERIKQKKLSVKWEEMEYVRRIKIYYNRLKTYEPNTTTKTTI